MFRLCFCANLLVLCAFTPSRAADDPTPKEDAILLELDDIKIPAARVYAIEQSWLKTQKLANPAYKLDPENVPVLRRQIALKELEVLMIQKYAKDHKLAADTKESEKRLEDFKSGLAEQGKTYDGFLAEISKSPAEFAAINAAMMAIERQLEKDVPDEEITKTLDEAAERLPLRRSAHILVMYKGAKQSEQERSKEDAKKLVDETLAKVKAGEDFSKLAGAHSDCPSKNQGGDLDWTGRKSDFVDDYLKALYAIEKEGEVSPVIETEFGYHIIKLTGLKKKEDFRPGVKEHLVSQRMQKLLQQLREENSAKLKFNNKLLGLPEGQDPMGGDLAKPPEPKK